MDIRVYRSVFPVLWQCRVLSCELPEGSIIADDRSSIVCEGGCNGLLVGKELRGAVRGPGDHGGGINSPRLQPGSQVVAFVALRTNGSDGDAVGSRDPDSLLMVLPAMTGGGRTAQLMRLNEFC